MTLVPESLAAGIDATDRAGAAAVPGIDQDLAAIIYTSGTTGEPNGVMLSHRNLGNTTAAIARYLGQRGQDVTCCMLPLEFSYGLFQVLVAIFVGSTVLLERSFAYPFDVLGRIERHRATILPGVPTYFARLLGMLPLSGIDLSSVRIMTNAAAALPPAHLLRLQEAFPNAAVYAMYGQTECTRATYLDPALASRHPDSVGRAIPNCEVYLVDEEGRRLPDGSEGELVVRGANVMRGYWGKPEKTAAKLIEGPLPGERVLLTGDRFRSTADGLLHFVARNDDIFKCRGEKVAPSAIEHVLYQMPDIAEAAVIGVDDASDGMAIKAVIVPVAGREVSEQQVRRHCRAHLDPTFIPKFIELRTTLPKTGSGKLLRRALTGEPVS
jgi:acyl-CoA synthetase (AMP-forming)/AMP-acid ligase II